MRRVAVAMLVIFVAGLVMVGCGGKKEEQVKLLGKTVEVVGKTDDGKVKVLFRFQKALAIKYLEDRIAQLKKENKDTANLEKNLNYLKEKKIQAVYLAGTFNGWKGSSPDNPDKMTYDQKAGIWKIEKTFDPGESISYKFVVNMGAEKKEDGTEEDIIVWIEDPKAPEYVDDGFGGLNSKLTIPSK